ncbi:hypothetical protein [Rhodovulum euryhalinum]|nr:hypothetical protein [Rhodovulum euryhalinum]
MAKTQALLAFLALADGRAVNRAALQDLLWSDRGQKQGRDSLRKALAELRLCLSAVEPNPLETTGGPVRLRPEAFDIDLFSQGARCGVESGLYQPAFLEGIDIPDDEFNRWLCRIRLELDAQGMSRTTPVRQVSSTPCTLLPARPLFEVGILPVDSAAGDGLADRIANLLLNDLITLFDQSSLIVPYDFRHMAGAPPGIGPDVMLSLQVSGLGDTFILAARASHVGSARVLWSAVDHVARADLGQEWVNGWTAATFDKLIERLAAFDGFDAAEHHAARMVVSAVDRIFRLTPGELGEAGRLLDEACDLVEASTVFGWNAFLTAFRAEKEGRERNHEMLERAEWCAARATELDRHNPLTVALVAHVYSFVLRDLDRAAEILAPVRDASSRSPFLADTLSMLHFYLGDYKLAHRFAREAVNTGRFSPFRFSFTTSLAMSELMLGQTEDAARHCKAALAQHRVRNGHLYEPTLRTLAAAAGHAGLRDEGRAALDILGRQGGYDPLERLKSGDTPYPNPDVLKVVRQGMERLNVQ